MIVLAFWVSTPPPVVVDLSGCTFSWVCGLSLFLFLVVLHRYFKVNVLFRAPSKSFEMNFVPSKRRITCENCLVETWGEEPAVVLYVYVEKTWGLRWRKRGKPDYHNPVDYMPDYSLPYYHTAFPPVLVLVAARAFFHFSAINLHTNVRKNPSTHKKIRVFCVTIFTRFFHSFGPAVLASFRMILLFRG